MWVTAVPRLWTSTCIRWRHCMRTLPAGLRICSSECFDLSHVPYSQVLWYAGMPQTHIWHRMLRSSWLDVLTGSMLT
eukprot:3809378-Amphidinium_carterae.2